MSFLYSRTAWTPLRMSFPTSRLSRPAITSFSTSHRAALNENNHDRQDVAEHYEKHKQDQLREQKEGRGEWKQELGSNSEQAVKADRGDVDASDVTIKKMQEETARSAEGKK